MSIPGGKPHRSILLFQASRHGQFVRIAFVHDVDIDSGTLEVVNHKHYDYASTALTSVNVTNTTGLYRDEKKKEMLVFVYIFCRVVVIFQYRLNVKIHVQVHFTVASHFYINVNVELYIHSFIQLYGGEKQVC